MMPHSDRVCRIVFQAGTLHFAKVRQPDGNQVFAVRPVTGNVRCSVGFFDMNMIDQIAYAIAEADGSEFQADPAKYRRLAAAALQPLANPTDAMIDAAHKAASFDDIWAINSRRDFKKAVKAMLAASAVRQNSQSR